jgi:hypothetical protein
MAKTKEVSEVVESEVTEPVVQPEAPASVPEVKSKKKKFKLLAGKHHVPGKVYVAGDVVESDDDLGELYGKTKFELVQG